MRSEISNVHPEIRTQIPDEIIDCNQVSFSAPLRIIIHFLMIIRFGAVIFRTTVTKIDLVLSRSSRFWG